MLHISVGGEGIIVRICGYHGGFHQLSFGLFSRCGPELVYLLIDKVLTIIEPVCATIMIRDKLHMFQILSILQADILHWTTALQAGQASYPSLLVFHFFRSDKMLQIVWKLISNKHPGLGPDRKLYKILFQVPLNQRS